jgi:hypothetical protein
LNNLNYPVAVGGDISCWEKLINGVQTSVLTAVSDGSEFNEFSNALIK